MAAVPLSPKSLTAQLEVSAHLHTLDVLSFWPAEMRAKVESATAAVFDRSAMQFRPAGIGLGAEVCTGNIPLMLQKLKKKKEKATIERIGKTFAGPTVPASDDSDDEPMRKLSTKASTKSSSSLKRIDPFAPKQHKKKVKQSPNPLVSLPSPSPATRDLAPNISLSPQPELSASARKKKNKKKKKLQQTG